MVQQQLIDGCKNGDRKAQRALYDQYSSALYGCCLKYAPNEPEAQDILQDSFMTIFQKIDQFKNQGSLEGWCKRIAINTALQRYRSTKVYALENDHTVAQEEVEVEDVDELNMAQLLEMIQRLPHQYRMVFSMYSLDGYSHKKIAALMKINEGPSKSNLSRARVLLQEMIREWRLKNTSDAS